MKKKIRIRGKTQASARGSANKNAPKRVEPKGILENTINGILSAALKYGTDFLIYEGVELGKQIVQDVAGVPLPIKFSYPRQNESLLDALIDGVVKSNVGQVVIALSRSIADRVSQIISDSWDTITKKIFGRELSGEQVREIVDLSDPNIYRTEIDVESEDEEIISQLEGEKEESDTTDIIIEPTVKERDEEVFTLDEPSIESGTNTDVTTKTQFNTNISITPKDVTTIILDNFLNKLIDILDGKWSFPDVDSRTSEICLELNNKLRSATWDGLKAGTSTKIFETNAYMSIYAIYHENDIWSKTLTYDNSIDWELSGSRVPARLYPDGESYKNALGGGSNYTITQPFRATLHNYTGSVINELITVGWSESQDGKLSSFADVLFKLFLYIGQDMDSIIPGSEIGSQLNGAHYIQTGEFITPHPQWRGNYGCAGISMKVCSLNTFMDLEKSRVEFAFASWRSVWIDRSICVVPYTSGMAQNPKALYMWILAHTYYPMVNKYVSATVKTNLDESIQTGVTLFPIPSTTIVPAKEPPVFVLDDHRGILLVQVDAFSENDLITPLVDGVPITSGVQSNDNGVLNPCSNIYTSAAMEAITWWYEIYGNEDGQRGAIMAISMSSRCCGDRPIAGYNSDHEYFYGTYPIVGSDNSTPITLPNSAQAIAQHTRITGVLGNLFIPTSDLSVHARIGGSDRLSRILRATGVIDHINKPIFRWTYKFAEYLTVKFHWISEYLACLYDVLMESAGIPAKIWFYGRDRINSQEVATIASIINDKESSLQKFLSQWTGGTLHWLHTKNNRPIQYENSTVAFGRVPRYRFFDLFGLSFLNAKHSMYTFKGTKVGKTDGYHPYTYLDMDSDYYSWYGHFISQFYTGRGNRLGAEAFKYCTVKGSELSMYPVLRYSMPEHYACYARTILGAKVTTNTTRIPYTTSSKIPMGVGPILWIDTGLRLGLCDVSTTYGHIIDGSERVSQEVFMLRELGDFYRNTTNFREDPEAEIIIKKLGQGFSLYSI